MSYPRHDQQSWPDDPRYADLRGPGPGSGRDEPPAEIPWSQSQPGYDQQGYGQPGYPRPATWQPDPAQRDYPPRDQAQPGYSPSGYSPAGYPQPGYSQPGYAPSGYAEPGYAQPGYGDSGYGEPGYAQPGYAEPGYGDSGYGDRGYAQPGYPEPGYPQPGYQQPGYPRPASLPVDHSRQAYGAPSQSSADYAQPTYGPESFATQPAFPRQGDPYADPRGAQPPPEFHPSRDYQPARDHQLAREYGTAPDQPSARDQRGGSPYPQAAPYETDPAEEETEARNGFALTALILGIFGGWGFVGIGFGIAGIRRAATVGRGRTMSIIGIVLAVLWVPLWIVGSHAISGGNSPSTAAVTPQSLTDPGCSKAEVYATQMSAAIKKNPSDPNLGAKYTAFAAELARDAALTKNAKASAAMKTAAADFKELGAAMTAHKAVAPALSARILPDSDAVDTACGLK